MVNTICSFCSNLYTNPVIVSCNCNICKSCIKILVDIEVIKSVKNLSPIITDNNSNKNKYYNVSCPSCKMILELEDIDNLKSNVILLDNINRYNSSLHTTPLCGHDCGKNAEIECIQCNAAFCNVCYNELHIKTAFKYHTTKELGKSNDIKNNLCNTHNKEIELYCNTCQSTICLKCFTFGEHQNHVCIPINDHFSTIKDKLLTFIPEINNRESNINKTVHDINTNLSKITEVYDELDNNILNVKKQLLDKIEHRFNILLNKSKHVRETKVQRLNNQLDALKETPDLLAKLAVKTNDAIASNDQWNQLEVSQQVEKTLKRLEPIHNFSQPCEDGTVIARLDAAAALKQLSIFGVITTSAEVRHAAESRVNQVQQHYPKNISLSSVAPKRNSLNGSTPISVKTTSPEFESQRETFKKAFENPHLFSEFTESVQITAHASRFDKSKSLQLVDSSQTSRVLHFDTCESRHGWVAFDCLRPLYMVKSRIQNGCNSDVEIQYSDDNLEWKTCCNTTLLSSEWNDATWRSVGAHRYWRYLIVNNAGKKWFEKFEWYYVPIDIMQSMNSLLAAAKKGVFSPVHK